jgi:hypothetical protein
MSSEAAAGVHVALTCGVWDWTLTLPREMRPRRWEAAFLFEGYLFNGTPSSRGYTGPRWYSLWTEIERQPDGY